MYKIGKKGCVFGHVDKFWKGHDGQIKKNLCKNAFLYLKIRVKGVLWKSFYEDDIQPEIQVAPRGPDIFGIQGGK